MSFEKPWEKPYGHLLTELKDRWSGELAYGLVGSFGHHRGFASTSVFAYPACYCTLRDYPLTVEISEFPFTGPPAVEAMDNVEYLRLIVSMESDYNIVIRHEGIHNKLLRTLGLSPEFQTGNHSFDKKYFIEARSEHDQNLIRQSNFQALIGKLEPLALIALLPRRLHWSQIIKDESQLSFAAIDNYANWLVELARFVTTRG